VPAVVIAIWLHAISVGLIILAFVMFGFPAALASLAVKNVQKEELF
jgi:hypothetical protein